MTREPLLDIAKIFLERTGEFRVEISESALAALNLIANL